MRGSAKQLNVISMEIVLIPQSGVLHAILSGRFSITEARRTFLEVIDVVEQSKFEFVFFDGHEILGNPTTIDRFYYGEFVANAVEELIQRGSLPKKPRFAYLLFEPVLDPLRLGETSAVKRGMDVKAFDNREEALSWLLEKV
jgi:hypothetical protein